MNSAAMGGSVERRAAERAADSRASDKAERGTGAERGGCELFMSCRRTPEEKSGGGDEEPSWVGALRGKTRDWSEDEVDGNARGAGEPRWRGQVNRRRRRSDGGRRRAPPFPTKPPLRELPKSLEFGCTRLESKSVGVEKNKVVGDSH